MPTTARSTIMVLTLALTGAVAGCAIRLPSLNPFSQAVGADSAATPSRQAEATAGLPPVAAAPAPRPENSFTTTIRNASQSVSDALTIQPKVVPASDPTLLSTKPGPVGPDLYISAARLMESRGDFNAAREHYERALEIDANSLPALIGLGRLYHRHGNMDEAIRVCRRAVEAHPQNAMARNDLGLCYARQLQLDPAMEALSSAVQLQPESKLYRNNLAAALVLAGRHEAALSQLTQVHGAAIAAYNLGYLLYKQGQPETSVVHFQRALELDPQLRPAAQMLMRLQRQQELARQQREAWPERRTPTVPPAPRPNWQPDIARPEPPRRTEQLPSGPLPEVIEAVPPIRAEAAPPVADQRPVPPTAPVARPAPSAWPKGSAPEPPEEAAPVFTPAEAERPPWRDSSSFERFQDETIRRQPPELPALRDPSRAEDRAGSARPLPALTDAEPTPDVSQPSRSGGNSAWPPATDTQVPPDSATPTGTGIDTAWPPVPDSAPPGAPGAKSPIGSDFPSPKVPDGRPAIDRDSRFPTDRPLLETPVRPFPPLEEPVGNRRWEEPSESESFELRNPVRKGNESDRSPPPWQIPQNPPLPPVRDTNGVDTTWPPATESTRRDANMPREDVPDLRQPSLRIVPQQNEQPTPPPTPVASPTATPAPTPNQTYELWPARGGF